MRALAGIVMIQERRMSRNILRFKALIPLAIPIPRTAPTKQWVVEMGRPDFGGDQNGGRGAKFGAKAPGGGQLGDLFPDRFHDPPAPGRKPNHNP